jgi:hypothetical protein
MALRSMCVGCIMIAWVKTLSKRGRVYMEDPVG